MAGKNVLWLRSIPSTKPDIRRSRPPIQKKNHSIHATFHTAWAMNDRLHCGKPEPFRRPDRCEVDRGTRFEACYLAPDCSGNAPAGKSNGNRHRKTSINMRARQ